MQQKPLDDQLTAIEQCTSGEGRLKRVLYTASNRQTAASKRNTRCRSAHGRSVIIGIVILTGEHGLLNSVRYIYIACSFLYRRKQRGLVDVNVKQCSVSIPEATDDEVMLATWCTHAIDQVMISLDLRLGLCAVQQKGRSHVWPSSSGMWKSRQPARYR
jgi:hypothetical protein